MNVKYIYGGTGCGKTHTAFEEFGMDCFKIDADSLNNSFPFQGYNGEKNLIIDEYDNDFKVTRLLTILDKYPLRLNIKGSSTWARFENVIITSNLTPKQLHKNAKQAHQAALWRRINKVIYKGKGEDGAYEIKNQNHFGNGSFSIDEDDYISDSSEYY